MNQLIPATITDLFARGKPVAGKQYYVKPEAGNMAGPLVLYAETDIPTFSRMIEKKMIYIEQPATPQVDGVPAVPQVPNNNTHQLL